MALATALGLKSATGLYLGPTEIVATQVVLTPLGTRDNQVVRQPIGEGGVRAAIEALRDAKHLLGQIVVGFDLRRFFLNTRTLPPIEDRDELIDALAGGLARMPGGLVSATTPVRLPGGNMATFVAGSRALAREVLDGLASAVKQKRLMLTGAPLALYALARSERKPERKRPTEVRIFLGEGQGLAVLAHLAQPVALHLFDCPTDRIARSIELAVLNLAHRARETLGLPGIDVLWLHVGEEAHELASRCEAGCGVPTLPASEIGIDDQSASRALAISALRPAKGTANLFESVFESAGFLKNFPVASASTLVLLLVGSWFAFDQTLGQLRLEARGLEKQAAADYKAIGLTAETLEKRHDALKEEFKLASYFFTDRAFWSDILFELPEIVPSTMTLEGFDGRDTVLFPRKTKSAAVVSSKLRQLSLAGMAPVEAGVKTPPELEQFIAGIKASTAIRSLLPTITASNVRLMPGKVQQEARILITTAP